VSHAASLRLPSAAVAGWHFFRKPKGLLIAVLAVMAMLAGISSGTAVIAPSLAAASLAAMAVDAPLLRWRKGRWVFPSGALLTGMIVAMILSRGEAWYVAPATAAFAVLSKYPLRGRAANIFNPAALALVVSFYVFSPGQDWWGALPGKPPLAVLLLLVLGAFVANRVNKLPALLSFLGVYFLLFTVTAFAGDPRKVVEIYRAPDVYAVLFYAFFMVTDPPTSPPRERDQLVFGAIAAAASYAIFELVGAAHFLLAGLLLANAWEAWRRD
jgi:enediyne biosynthesis protein E5